MAGLEWMAALTVEVAFFSSAGGLGYLVLDDATDGKLNTGTLGPVDYLDVIPDGDVKAAWIARGSQRFDGVYARAEAGRAGVTLDNATRNYDPTNLAGPYVAAGKTEIEPMRMFRLRASWAGITYPLWRGFADEWAIDYNLPAVSLTKLTGTDGTKVVANYDSVGGASVGGGEDTGARINRVLDNAGWSSALRSVATGKTTVQSTDLSSNAWTEVLLAADTEIGEVYFDASNRLVFRNRHQLLTDTRSNTPQAVFGDQAGELGFDRIDIANDDSQVRNIIRIARVGGTTQVASDAASQLTYQRKTWGRSDLIMQTDAAAADYAAYVLSFSKTAELRFTSIRLNPVDDPDGLWPQMLGRELGDRITIKFTPPGGGARIVRDAFIRGIRHDVTGSSWFTTWTLQDATNKFQFLVLDNATLGRLDYNALAY